MCLPLFRTLRRRRVPAHVLGRRGERVAARAIRRRGYRVLGRNLRTPAGEVDLLALDHGTLVVVEVKAGARADEAHLAARLGRAQRRRLGRAARWLSRRPGIRGLPVRVDLVTVVFDGRRSVVTIRRDLRRR